MMINFYIYTCSDKCKFAILLKASPETWGKSHTEKYYNRNDSRYEFNGGEV